MNNKKKILIIGLVVGIVTFILSLTLDLVAPNIQQNKWLFVGIGAGMTGATTSKLLSFYIYKNNPKLSKQAKINENDERYIIMRKTAAYYMWYVTLFMLFIMVLIFGVLQLNIAIWITLAVMLIHCFLYFIILNAVNKKM
ncbi:MAG: hypothetical protein RRZ73_06320 [Oscillospiraceae bacterium]